MAERREKSRTNSGVPRATGSAEGHGTPGFFGNEGAEEKCGRNAAENLRGPIEKHFHGADALGDPEADTYGGIEVAAGDVAEGGDHDGHSKTRGQRDAKKADAPARGLQVAVGADGAGAEENQSEGTEEFG
jgi:hypothetical protein